MEWRDRNLVGLNLHNEEPIIYSGVNLDRTRNVFICVKEEASEYYKIGIPDAAWRKLFEEEYY
jgi:hypothetical protein